MCSSRVFLRVPCGPIRLCTRSDGSCACESGGTGHGAPPGRRRPARTCCKVNLSLLENSTTVLCMAFSSSSLLEDRSAADTCEKQSTQNVRLDGETALHSPGKSEEIRSKSNFYQGLD